MSDSASPSSTPVEEQSSLSPEHQAEQMPVEVSKSAALAMAGSSLYALPSCSSADWAHP